MRGDALMKAMIAPHSHRVRIIAASLAVMIPTALRLLLGSDAGVPFITYFPPVLLCAAFLGMGYALAVLAVCTVLAVLLFIPPEFSMLLTWRQFLTVLLFVTGSLAMMFVGHLLRNAVILLDERTRQVEAFNAELQHRTNNALQMVQALASRASHSTDPAEFYRSLAGRLEALAKGNELLRFGSLPSCEMEDLVSACIAPFPEHQFHVSGPSCSIARSAATPVMMALHELCTNASKYGALSNDHGHVELTWSVEGEGTPRISISWKEENGPPVTSPERKGFGSRLLVAHAGIRSITHEFLPDGVHCRMVADGANGSLPA